MTQFEQIAMYNAFMHSLISDLDAVMDELRHIRRVLVSGTIDTFELNRLLSISQLKLSDISQRIHNETAEAQNRVELESVIQEAITPFVRYTLDDMITDDGSDLKTEPRRKRKKANTL